MQQNLFLQFEAPNNVGYGRTRCRSGNVSLATSPRWDMSPPPVVNAPSLCGPYMRQYQEEQTSNNQPAFFRQRSYCGYERTSARMFPQGKNVKRP